MALSSLKLRNAEVTALNRDRHRDQEQEEGADEEDDGGRERRATKNKIVTIKPSEAAWWIKNPPKTWTQKQLYLLQRQLEQRNEEISQQRQRKQSFSGDMGELFRNISMHGYGRLFDPQLSLWEKLIWLLLHMTCMTGLIVILSFTWERFVAQYIVINLHNPIYANELVPFPAVSICSNNRLSRQAVKEYANLLSSKDPKKRDIEYYLTYVGRFISLYYRYSNEIMPDDVGEFQAFLEDYDTLDNETFYDVRKNMKMLTPKCENLITLCMLAGLEVDCFTNTTFEESHTGYGLCCTFNTKDSYRQRTRRNAFILPDMGLTVVLNTSKSDDLRTILNTDGYIVVIHDAFDFADATSSGAQEVFPSVGEESYVSVRTRLIDTESSLRSFSPVNRRCYFTDEAPNQDFLLGGSYSFNNCIQRCRVRSIMALCNCLPFYMPLSMVESGEGIIYCNLEHVSCLNRYAFKWRNVMTQRMDLPELKRELEESLLCPLCIAPCEDIQYRVSLSSLPLDRFRTSTSSRRLSEKGLKIEDTSVLRVHFSDTTSPYYRRVIGNAWVEIFSTLGNMVSIFVGFSIIVVFEVLYYFIRSFARSLKRMCATDTHRAHRKHRKREEISETELYICP